MTVETVAGETIRSVLRASGLTQAELARRAGLPRSVLNAYLHGTREPGTEVLARIVTAAGRELRTRRSVRRVDSERAGRLLAQVLDLAESLPTRRRGKLMFPSLRSVA